MGFGQFGAEVFQCGVVAGGAQAVDFYGEGACFGVGAQVGFGRHDLLRQAPGFIPVMHVHGLCQDLR